MIVLGLVFTIPGLDPSTPTPNDDTRVTGSARGDIPKQTAGFGDGEKINVYKINSLDLDKGKVQSMQTALVGAGWSNTECTLCDKYGFVLKGGSNGSANDMTKDECLTLAKAFLTDSGLDGLLAQNEISYEFASSVNDDLVVTYCYFMCEGERTGAYIRFIFEGDKRIGEIQAHIYSSECIDSLELLTLDQALKSAYQVNSEGALEEVNTADYTIKEEGLVYINGLPYYHFGGYGKNIRGYIDGYALAINIDDSAASAQLYEQYSAFSIN